MTNTKYEIIDGKEYQKELMMEYQKELMIEYQKMLPTNSGKSNIEMNLAELKARCEYWNQALKARERVSLNEVYYDLGLYPLYPKSDNQHFNLTRKQEEDTRVGWVLESGAWSTRL